MECTWTIGQLATMWITHKILVGKNFGKSNVICKYYTKPQPKYFDLVVAKILYCHALGWH